MTFNALAPRRRPRLDALGRGAATPALAFLLLAVPALARAQGDTPPPPTATTTQADALPPGERYHIEVEGALWNPTNAGQVASEQFGFPGTRIDFNSDLAFPQTRFDNLRIFLRASKKSRFRIEYTPVSYSSQPTLSRTVVFNDINFTASLPVAANFQWKVWRFGYEYDVAYFDRGYAGFFLEARYTQFRASLTSLSPSVSADEYTSAKAPLPAIGFSGRVYAARNVSISGEVSAFRLPQIKSHDTYSGSYYDWNIYGTVDLNRYVGAQVGWRRMTTDVTINQDYGNFKFQGLWFGAVVRY